MTATDLHEDPRRARFLESGIYVRAINTEGRSDNVDITHLDRQSLNLWLRSRNDIDWPISVVMGLLGHERHPS